MDTDEVIRGAVIVATGDRRPATGEGPVLERLAMAGFLASYSGPTRQS